jgi:ATP-dependent helicase/nuclease subunit A
MGYRGEPAMNATPDHLANAEQRTAADPEASTWVTASAGTGKTRVLVHRLLRLLLQGTPANRVMCVTFTKAAAAEMAGRLFGQLADWVVLDDAELRNNLAELTGSEITQDELDRARRLFATVLDAPGGLKIQTIHSLCESLLARFPLEARVPTHFQVLDEGTAMELLIAARDQVLEAARAQERTPLAEAVAMLSEISGEYAFAGVMVALTNARAKIRKMVDAYGGLDGVIAATHVRLGVDADEDDAAVVRAACSEGAFDELGLRRAARAMLASSVSDQRRGVKLTAWLAAPDRRTALFDDYVSVFLTDKGEPRKTQATKKTLAMEPDAATVLGVEADRLIEVAAHRKAVGAARRAQALLVIGDALLTSFAAQKTRHARLDYEDLIVETQRLLRRPGVAPWVLYKLDGGVDHILLDEAQDTSPDQWDIVAALAGEFFAGSGARDAVRSIFVVGDEKQSIYSFQGADPDAFDKMSGHFRTQAEGAGQPWKPLALTRSFRAAPALLSVVDKVFEAPSAGVGVIAAGQWPRHLANREGEGGLVELWPPIKPKAAAKEEPWQLPLQQGMSVSPEALLAAQIAERIRGWLRDGEMLAARGRPITPGDVMILVRRRNSFFEEMVRALKQRGVSVAGTDRMVLTDQLAVMDLMALGHFALLPDDDLTLAIVLKTPLLGFDDARLFDLAWERGTASLWSVLRRRHNEASDFARAYQTLSGLLSRADLVPPFDFFAHVLGGGGREQLLGRLGPQADDPIDEFLNRALTFERDHAPSLEGFLHWLETGEAEIKRDLDDGRGEVRVMTVHGAKGLESPVVFLPDTCAVPLEREPLFWTCDDDPLLLWPVRKDLDDTVTAQARDALTRAQMAEYRRLLYVALTRAEDRLYVCGWETTRGRADGCWYDMVAAAMQEIGEPLGGQTSKDEARDGFHYAEKQTALPDSKPAPTAPAAQDEMPEWIAAAPPEEAAIAQPLAPSRPLQDEPPAQAPLATAPGADDPFRRGVILHRLLQFLPDVLPEQRAAAAERYLGRQTLGLAVGERQALAAEALAVLAEPAFAAVFSPDALAEAPIAGVVGDRVISGQIDRLLVDEAEVLIVDYKSNREPPDRDEGVPAAYVRQMAAYRAALQAIYPKKSIRCALLWTAAPRLIELSDATLSAAAP